MDRRAIVMVLPVAVTLGAIFLLAQQDINGTEKLAWRVEQALVHVVPPTGKGEIGEPTWFGLTIRRLAHVAEFFALGLAVALALHMLAPARLALDPRVAYLAVCFVASLADELHKLFVPGRHFDTKDLLLDAAGYLLALALWQLAGLLT